MDRPAIRIGTCRSSSFPDSKSRRQQAGITGMPMSKPETLGVDRWLANDRRRGAQLMERPVVIMGSWHSDHAGCRGWAGQASRRTDSAGPRPDAGGAGIRHGDAGSGWFWERRQAVRKHCRAGSRAGHIHFVCHPARSLRGADRRTESVPAPCIGKDFR